MSINWKRPRTPLLLMMWVHLSAIAILLVGIVVGATQATGSSGREASIGFSVGWAISGIFLAPLITIGAIVWSTLLARNSRARKDLPDVHPPMVIPTRTNVYSPSASALDPVETSPAPASTPIPEAGHMTSADRTEAQSNDITWHRPSEAERPAPASRKSLRTSNYSPPRVEYFVIGSDGYPSVEIEGEFARMDAIHRVLGRKPKLDEEIEAESLAAELRPEPTNKYDSNAVMVLIGGHHIGYIGRELAAIYQEPLTRLTRAGVAPMTRARVWASARRNWEGNGLKYFSRVTIALGHPDMLAPANNPPEAPYSLVPWGGGLQVTGEENHLDVLSEFTSDGGESIVIGTIHVLEVPGPKGSVREVVEVRIDGYRIGQMTSATSQHFFPTIKHLDDQGLQTAVWLKVKGSAIAAQAVLQATRSHELLSDWFISPSTIPAIYPRQIKPNLSSDRAEDVAEIAEHSIPAPMWDDDKV